MDLSVSGSNIRFYYKIFFYNKLFFIINFFCQSEIKLELLWPFAVQRAR